MKTYYSQCTRIEYDESIYNFQQFFSFSFYWMRSSGLTCALHLHSHMEFSTRAAEDKWMPCFIFAVEIISVFLRLYIRLDCILIREKRQDHKLWEIVPQTGETILTKPVAGCFNHTSFLTNLITLFELLQHFYNTGIRGHHSVVSRHRIETGPLAHCIHIGHRSPIHTGSVIPLLHPLPTYKQAS